MILLILKEGYQKHKDSYKTENFLISFLYVCMVNTIYLFSFVEIPRKLFKHHIIYVVFPQS